MERASRRITAARDTGDNGTSLRHRRRRDANALAARASSNTSASQSDDGAETDSSSVAPQDAGSGSTLRRASKKLPPRDAKKRGSQRDENPAADERGTDDADGDDELDEEDDVQSGAESRGTASSANGKRERSMSSLSTTSSSSSVASDHDEDGREALHVEKLEELEKKKKMVEDGTLAEFCRRVTEFKEERNQLLETAEWHKDLQLKNSQDLYGFEVQRAHNLWQQGKDALKSGLLQQVDALVLKLKQELVDLSKADTSGSGDATGATNSAPSASTSPPSDSTEQEATESEQEKPLRTKAPIAPKRRKVGGVSFQETTVRLPLDSINTDLASILGDRAHHAEIATAKQSTKAIDNFRYERRRLFCGKYIFEDGDEVVVSSPVINEDYIGTISSVTEDAVYIKLSSGQKARVYLDLIEHKRCEVKPFLRGSAGVGALRATGWSECEPF